MAADFNFGFGSIMYETGEKKKKINQFKLNYLNEMFQ